MLTTSPEQVQRAPRAPERRTYHEIRRVVAKSSLRTGLAWGVVFGIYVASQVLAYTTTYKTVASRQLLVTLFGHDAGISALVGPATRINTVAGYAQWKCLTVVAIMGAVWGILTSTKLTRGEEDQGRWEMLLCGPVTRRAGAREALEGFAIGGCGIVLITSAILVALGRTSTVHIGAGHSFLFALGGCAGALMFLAVGAFCAQLATTRRQAAGFASAVLGVSYALRMVADSGVGLNWLRWVSPLGWIEELQPLTKPTPLALVPMALLIVVTSVAAVLLAGRRDLGAGTLKDRSSAERVHVLPTSRIGLSIYLTRPMFIAWALSICAYGLLLGSIAKSGGQFVTSTTSIRRVLAHLGVSGADAYLGLALVIMSIALCFVAAGQVASTRREESTGQLDNLLVRPLARLAWFGERVTLSVVVVIVLGLVAGLSTWLGAISDHAHVSFVSMIEAGLNVAVPALVLLGIGVAAFAFVPRRTSVVTYSVFAWFVIVDIIGSVAQMNHWVLDLSALHQIAPAPAASVDWGSCGVMVLFTTVVVAASASRFNRRDLKGE